MPVAAIALSVGPVDWASAQDRCLAIRRQVFIEEQGIDAQIEIDGQDPAGFHVLATLDGRDVGTGRLLRSGKIGRVAVLASHRGGGIGIALMQALLATAQSQGLREVMLSAQASAVGFYLALGFQPQGEPHIEAGIPHQHMHFVLYG